MEQPGVYGHSRSRTTSSNVIPGPPLAQQPMMPQQYAHQRQYQHMPQQQQLQQNQQQQQHQQQQPQQGSAQHWRRSPSINTFSTSSTFQPPAAYRNSSSTDLRRSTSSRSVNTASQGASYVALLRKQKATVWCERAQYEDPHLQDQQRLAKMRANLEMHSGYGNGRTRTGLSATGKVAAKIRHGKTPMIGYAPGETHVGVGGVPKRLLESDGDQESDEEDDSTYKHQRPQHNRAGSSGRSSTGSGQRGLTYRTSSGPIPPQAARQSSGSTPERTGSLAKDAAAAATMSDSISGRAPSSGSGGSAAERLDNLTDLGKAPSAAVNSMLNSVLTREKSVKTADELKRRGSIDERSGTLTGGRLFIANPD
ncbi:hypothetical protein VHEMI00958 [[Torrubiella] hemipterigena]|uniref:Uncharacterized protein n=1 Tax=[Torrubiella] hemipterigena TaxID=1531966 RepID=A0A0A1SKN5_9HYPO|nr:hypothetical protein VHEMI00958 [[Torrubiella] hemipterigena]